MDSISIFEKHYPGRRSELKRIILIKSLDCFNKYGIESTTIDMIKHECETSVGAIYHHFGNKDGIIANLFFIALDDQLEQRLRYFENIKSAKNYIFAIVYSYVDWIVNHKDLAKFQFFARYSVIKGSHQTELIKRNQLRNKQLFQYLEIVLPYEKIKILPSDLIFSLVIGPSESYARAWLSEKVSVNPMEYREEFANSAWLAVERFFT
ncbi:TetR/AcrR family transcriptional regulator [Acinetobacter baumannii]|nr:TetR/AcrR family transcriptional regulator [Acinetobacter baumannii]